MQLRICWQGNFVTIKLHDHCPFYKIIQSDGIGKHLVEVFQMLQDAKANLTTPPMTFKMTGKETCTVVVMGSLSDLILFFTSTMDICAENLNS